MKTFYNRESKSAKNRHLAVLITRLFTFSAGRHRRYQRINTSARPRTADTHRNAFILKRYNDLRLVEVLQCYVDDLAYDLGVGHVVRAHRDRQLIVRVHLSHEFGEKTAVRPEIIGVGAIFRHSFMFSRTVRGEQALLFTRRAHSPSSRNPATLTVHRKTLNTILGGCISRRADYRTRKYENGSRREKGCM